MGELLAADLIRDIPDFPVTGILFKDITPLLANPAAFQEVIDLLVEQAQEHLPDIVVGIESRGFLFGVPVALSLGLPFVPVRKAGKLPYLSFREEYALEYGTSIVEIHQDVIKRGQRVLIVDDLLATGGTALASAKLIERAGGVVSEISFVVELEFLPGRSMLDGYRVESLIKIP